MSYCAKDGCPAKAVAAPSLLIPPKGYRDISPELTPERCLPLILGLALCQKHLEEFGPIRLLEESRQRIRNAMAAIGRAEPDFERAAVRSVALDSGEYAAFLSAEAKSQDGGTA